MHYIKFFVGILMFAANLEAAYTPEQQRSIQKNHLQKREYAVFDKTPQMAIANANKKGLKIVDYRTKPNSVNINSGSTAASAAAVGQSYAGGSAAAAGASAMPTRNIGAAASQQDRRGRSPASRPTARTRSPSPVNTVRVDKTKFEELKKLEGYLVQPDGSIKSKTGTRYVPEGWARASTASRSRSVSPQPRGRSPIPEKPKPGTKASPKGDSGRGSRSRSPSPPKISKTAEQVLLENLNAQLVSGEIDADLALQIVVSNAFESADQIDEDLLTKILSPYPNLALI
ncbi:MAG: hypothetical protein C0582_03690 [Alphaproteobacteria bacterium]|nr:MAG: hypothetical protein C0582_03690 [Alphaproteobacteria bacterium]